MKKLFLSLLLLVFPFSFPAVNAQTTFVSEGESVQKAIEKAAAGDTIMVRAGTYHEQIVLKPSIHLIGEDAEEVIFDGKKQYPDVILALGNNLIQGLTVTGGGAYEGAPKSAIKVAGDHVVVRDCFIRDNDDYGIYLKKGDGTIIEQNLFMHNGGADQGIAIQHPHLEATNTIIRYNTMVGNRIAINILDGVTPRIENNIITDSFFCAIYEFNWDAFSNGQRSRGFAAVENNVFYYNVWSPGFYGSATPPAVENLTDGNIKADPQFRDPAHGDYSVPAGSPAYRKGAFEFEGSAKPRKDKDETKPAPPNVNTDIPSVLLNQKRECPPGKRKSIARDTKLVEWHLKSRDEVTAIAEHFVEHNQDALGVSLNDLKLRESSTMPGNTGLAVFQQYYHGIPVIQAELRMGLNAYGVVVWVDNRLQTGITAPTKPVLTSDETVEILKKRYNQSELNFTPTLCIYLNKLAWLCSIYGSVKKDVYVDAQTGEIVWETSNVRS